MLLPPSTRTALLAVAGVGVVFTTACQDAQVVGKPLPAHEFFVSQVPLGEGDRCLPRPISLDPSGVPDCHWYEATGPDQPADCRAARSGSQPAERDAVASVRHELARIGICGTTGPDCTEFTVCTLQPVPAGPDRDACMNDLEPEVSHGGFCYISERETDCDGRPLGNLALVAGCPEGARRRLRFVDPPDAEIPLPGPGDLLFFGACSAPAAPRCP